MAVVTDFLPQTAAGIGGFALLMFAARTALHVDRPLRHAVDEIQKRLDNERSRGDRLDKTVDELREQLRSERDTAATAMQIHQSLTKQLELAQQRIADLVAESLVLRADAETAREQARRLGGERR